MSTIPVPKSRFTQQFRKEIQKLTSFSQTNQNHVVNSIKRNSSYNTLSTLPSQMAKPMSSNGSTDCEMNVCIFFSSSFTS